MIAHEVIHDMLLRHLLYIGSPESLKVGFRGVTLEQYASVAVRRYRVKHAFQGRLSAHIHIDSPQAVRFIIQQVRVAVPVYMESLHITT